MKSVLAATAALAILTAPAFAAEDKKTGQHEQPPSASSSSDATNSNDAGKNTNSDGSSGAEGTSGTSVNDGAGSKPDQSPASDGSSTPKQ